MTYFASTTLVEFATGVELEVALENWPATPPGPRRAIEDLRASAPGRGRGEYPVHEVSDGRGARLPPPRRGLRRRRWRRRDSGARPGPLRPPGRRRTRQVRRRDRRPPPRQPRPRRRPDQPEALVRRLAQVARPRQRGRNDDRPDDPLVRATDRRSRPRRRSPAPPRRRPQGPAPPDRSTRGDDHTHARAARRPLAAPRHRRFPRRPPRPKYRRHPRRRRRRSPSRARHPRPHPRRDRRPSQTNPRALTTPPTHSSQEARLPPRPRPPRPPPGPKRN